MTAGDQLNAMENMWHELRKMNRREALAAVAWLRSHAKTLPVAQTDGRTTKDVEG